MRQYLFAALALLISAQAVADDADFGNHKPDQGWFWYEEPPPEVKKKPEKKVEPTKSTTAEATDKEKKPMSVAWLREMLPKLREKAIDNPSRENLAAEAYVKRILMDKSQRYSEEMQKYIYSDPILDENNRVPLSKYGKNEFMGKQFTAQENALKYLAKNVGGLFVFFDSKCDFCKAQIRVINYLKESYGFEVKYISMDGKGLPGIPKWEPDNGHAKLLDLKVFPTTVFAVPPKTYLVVSQGIMAKDELSERILTAATTNKLLPDNMEKDVNPFDRGVLTVEDMQDGASDKPEEFVKTIKEKLKKRY
jgi:conjugal transfer pilus assembly protein TraF